MKAHILKLLPSALILIMNKIQQVEFGKGTLASYLKQTKKP